MPARILTVLPLLAFSGLASAHVEGVHLSGSLMGGVLHPLLGLDHLVALVAIGIWIAFQEKAVQLTAMPLSLLALLLGTLAGLGGFPVPGVEAAIVLSVVAIGLLLAFRQRLPAWGAGLMAGGFMLFHGVAHGAEMEPGSDALGYVVGLVVASGVVILLARALGVALQRTDRPVGRVIGIAVMLAGGLFAAG
ncbi:MAG: HupE/UreJ family protein [Guyparkeria sp.]